MNVVRLFLRLNFLILLVSSENTGNVLIYLRYFSVPETASHRKVASLTIRVDILTGNQWQHHGIEDSNRFIYVCHFRRYIFSVFYKVMIIILMLQSKCRCKFIPISRQLL